MTLYQRLQEMVLVFLRGFTGIMQVLHGVWKLLRLPQPRISVFGGSRSKLDSPYAQQAHLLAHKLAQHNLSVLTGGGPGIMEAVSCGVAHEVKERTMGIGVSDLPGESGINSCATQNVQVDFFWVRKWLLLDYSIGFVIFPGGFGTIDELSDVLTLMQTGKVPHAPIILVGIDFWKLWMIWVKQAEQDGFINAQEVSWIMMTDDLDLVVSTLVEHCKKANIKKE
jgi:uncharacterized protein (TIGR00730 family)